MDKIKTDFFGKGSMVDRRDRIPDGFLNELGYSEWEEMVAPATAVVQFSAFLAEHGPSLNSEDLRRFCQDILQSARTLQRALENLAFYRTISMTTGPYDTEAPVHHVDSIWVLARSVCRECASAAERIDDLDLNVEDTALLAPERPVRKLLRELADNAFEYSRFGESVVVVGAISDLQYRLSVVSQGEYISVDDIDRLTTLAEQTAVLNDYRILNRSLVLCTQLVRSLSGSMTIESGNGVTKVSLLLPLLLSPSDGFD
jgi:signal transduction histidine kinase